MAKTSSATPLMEQYLNIKAEYKNVLLLYRMGDFYETFYEDAKTLSKVIGIALTKRAHGKSAEVPLAGFPYHALDNYLPKLLNHGLRVAICEQVEDPKLAKGVVKREVVEIASPGATMSDKILDSKSNNFLMALKYDENICGMALADVSTGIFWLAEFSMRLLPDNLVRYQPKEILVAAKDFDFIKSLTHNKLNAILTKRDDWIFNRDFAYENLLNHFKSHSLKGFGCDDMTHGVVAAGIVIHYITENYKTRLEHFVKLQVLNLSEFMVLDESTRRNLEIAQSNTNQLNAPTLLSILDKTATPMGARMFKQWLRHPLLSKEKIIFRQECVKELLDNKEQRSELLNLLNNVFDLERLLAKIVTGKANGRDVVNLKNSLNILPPVQKLFSGKSFKSLNKISSQINTLTGLAMEIEKAVVESPPLTILEGGLIKEGYNAELDELRSVAETGKDWLLNYQATERQRSGIPKLKVSYNKVFGYYLEITNVHKEKVPETYIRKQTLVNAERYITPELKEWEEKILGAEDKINTLEYNLFQIIRGKIKNCIFEIQQNSTIIAELDCINSFAVSARENKYVCPQINDSRELLIKEGRHPVVEKNLAPEEDFIANDVTLNIDSNQIWIITGPNMAGKSTFLRQIGLITLMAQVGSYVPASSASIGIVDRIFTRVGASDNLAFGESTFLVEMNETANILNNATNKSLILLDEIGRGTSTFDGLSIAWAVTEYIHNNPHIRSKTLFATHYHELTELALIYPRIHNYNVAVEEWEDQVIFLRKIVAGGTDNSYGIYVAQLAGLPVELIERAKEILANLEANELNPHNKTPKIARRRAGSNVDAKQVNLFSLPQKGKVEKELENLDVNNITPLQALQKLNDLKKLIR
jgi:DNA mismatch repair protein MutS